MFNRLGSVKFIYLLILKEVSYARQGNWLIKNKTNNTIIFSIYLMYSFYLFNNKYLTILASFVFSGLIRNEHKTSTCIIVCLLLFLSICIQSSIADVIWHMSMHYVITFLACQSFTTPVSHNGLLIMRITRAGLWTEPRGPVSRNLQSLTPQWNWTPGPRLNDKYVW